MICTEKNTFSTSDSQNCEEILTPERLANAARTTVERAFWLHYEVADNGCWEWHGSRNHKGYGIATFVGTQMGAHRVSYEFLHGLVPDGMQVLHSCDNPPCGNPAHLRAGTQKENSQDMVARGRQKGGCSGRAHPGRGITTDKERLMRVRGLSQNEVTL